MKPQPKRKGRRPTAGVSALPLVRQAHYAHHRHVLLDELNEALHAAYRSNRRKPEEMPVLPDGGLDANIQPDDPVTIPYWAFKAVYDLVGREAIYGSNGTGRQARWRRQYRENQIHWHRYALVRKAMIKRTGDKRSTGDPDVYDVVSRLLRGTAFAAAPSGIHYSYDQVRAALKRGEHVRFYRSTSDHLYEFLLNTPGPVTVVAT